MSFVAPSLVPAIPELFLLGMVCTLLLVDLFLSDAQRYLTYLLALATLAGVAFLTSWYAPTERVLAFSGMFVGDPLATTLKLVCYATVAVTFVFSREHLIVRGLFKSEFFVLGLTALLGIDRKSTRLNSSH